MINFVLFCEIITANLKMCFVKLKKEEFRFSYDVFGEILGL